MFTPAELWNCWWQTNLKSPARARSLVPGGLGLPVSPHGRPRLIQNPEKKKRQIP